MIVLKEYSEYSGVLKAIERPASYGEDYYDLESFEGFGIHFYPMEGYGLKIGKIFKKIAKIALPVAAGVGAMLIPGVGPAVAGVLGKVATAPMPSPQPTLEPMPQYIPTSPTPYVPGTYAVPPPAYPEKVAPPLIPKFEITPEMKKYLLYGGISLGGLFVIMMLTRR